MRSRTPPRGVAVSENSQPDAAQLRFATRPSRGIKARSIWSHLTRSSASEKGGISMTGEPERPARAGEAQARGEDTVELELTAAEQLALTPVAPPAARSAPIEPGKSGYSGFVRRRTQRIDLVCTLAFATLILGITAATGWRAVVGEPTVPAVTVAASSAPVAAAAAEPQQPLLHVTNPFDASEVFEFPAETTEAAARNAIAELLLQRARDRRRQGLLLSHASHRQPRAIAADNPADIFVTRLSGSADWLGGTP
jgi:hypothetical protein